MARSAKVVGEAEMKGGRTLYDALRRLGMEPDAMAWAVADREVALVIVTSLADRIGPLPIYEALYRAQEWGAVSKTFDMSDVTLCSPKSSLGAGILENLKVKRDGTLAHFADKRVPVETAGFFFGDPANPTYVPGPGIYGVARSGYTATEDYRRWRQVTKAIEALAA